LRDVRAGAFCPRTPEDISAKMKPRSR
jgi:hypothetical protein